MKFSVLFVCLIVFVPLLSAQSIKIKLTSPKLMVGDLEEKDCSPIEDAKKSYKTSETEDVDDDVITKEIEIIEKPNPPEKLMERSKRSPGGGGGMMDGMGMGMGGGGGGGGGMGGGGDDCDKH